MQGNNKYNIGDFVWYAGQEMEVMAIRYVGLIEGFMYEVLNGINKNKCWVKETDLKQK